MITSESMRAPAVSDDSEAFSTLYKNHGRAAYGLALRLTRDHWTADDAFQEAMLRAWRATSSVRPGNHRAWMYRIINRECSNIQKRNDARRRREISVTPKDFKKDETDKDHANLYIALGTLMLGLPALDQQLIRLHYEQGLSQRRISLALDIPQQTVSSRLKRAISNLRHRLIKICD